MAFERVVCEVYFILNVSEDYSELRYVYDYAGMEFDNIADADRFLVEEGYNREEPGGKSWRKSEAYRYAYVTRHLREVKEL